MQKMLVQQENPGREEELYQDMDAQQFTYTYTDGTWVNSSLTFRKCWQNDVMGIRTNANSGNRLVMFYVGGINGFLPNA
jgi:hypothetical protein